MNLRDHLQAIYDQSGKLTPEMVVTEARDPAHPLHSRFEWDDALAGEAWRREQAHELIRSVRIAYKQAADGQDAASIRAFHAVRGDDGYAYEPAGAVAADPFLTKLVLADMRREWQQLKRRYERFAEFAEMVKQDVA